ncbi:RHTO0S02e01948g1_1 [Rhodotorula toruloides]|uniref:RHTO0S02e01948g1_1 n=2 Tax=Rhodotorula toruloides TaxID=5286 RepID=A0A061AFV0_RHOTO|nr:zinc finger, C2H2-type domain containing protein [Rhodotorula toruloides NP11]EMS22066.1 zinc finger, C2H2-type domain containing protein [Rhodotorula toruloides NP11]CDR36422.1 RHTO0S02e01948g1_1 [Rhodotorula toruloides]
MCANLTCGVDFRLRHPPPRHLRGVHFDAATCRVTPKARRDGFRDAGRRSDSQECGRRRRPALISPPRLLPSNLASSTSSFVTSSLASSARPLQVLVASSTRKRRTMVRSRWGDDRAVRLGERVAGEVEMGL